MFVGDTDVSVVHRLWPRDRFVVSGFRVGFWGTLRRTWERFGGQRLRIWCQ